MTPSEVWFVGRVKVGSCPGMDNGHAGSGAARSRDGTNGPVSDTVRVRSCWAPGRAVKKATR